MSTPEDPVNKCKYRLEVKTANDLNNKQTAKKLKFKKNMLKSAREKLTNA